MYYMIKSAGQMATLSSQCNKLNQLRHLPQWVYTCACVSGGLTQPQGYTLWKPTRNHHCDVVTRVRARPLDASRVEHSSWPYVANSQNFGFTCINRATPPIHVNRQKDFFKVLTKNTSNWQQTHGIHKQANSNANHVAEQFLFSPQGIVEALPNHIQPYLRLMRFDRPIGTWLLYLPCTWSISLAAAPGSLPDMYMLALFGVGALLMRGAGCTINDMWDRDYDKRVARTKDRPLASGKITQFQALTFLGLQLSASLGILLALNVNTITLGVCSMIPVIVYPLMKRITFWPQAFLGLTFNWGAVMGWTAVTGTCAWQVVLPLYTSCIAWTLVYDTIYAHQDKDDDIMVGVKSTALRFGADTKKWLTGFTGLMVGGLSVTGLACDQTWPYYFGVAMVAAHLSRQIYSVDLNNTDDCGKTFRSNKNIGLVLLASIIVANLYKKVDALDEENNREQG